MDLRGAPQDKNSGAVCSLASKETRLAGWYQVVFHDIVTCIGLQNEA